MTEIDFYETLLRCFTADPKHRRCGSCPLLRSERACEYVLRDEIRHRLVQARKDRANGFTQMDLFSVTHSQQKECV